MDELGTMRLDPVLERRRRMRTLALTVPALLNVHLKPTLGIGRFAFVVRMLVRAPAYARRFARPTDDEPLRKVKQTFLLVGVLYQELRVRVGETSALQLTQQFLLDLACAVQRQIYLPREPAQRTWDWLHDAHEAQMAEGFISANDNGGTTRSPDRVSLHVVRCRFHECFRDMGNGAITEAFCRSDEVVFNEYSPTVRFHRGGKSPDTIARGAHRCVFIYERVAASSNG
jgi:hypothetical protein